ncbi:MAG: DUF1127 domain-containing protein [Desulfobacterales bacterium]|nr:DUF1127 domain-containing protein [Desulfobacterales bacterium]
MTTFQDCRDTRTNYLFSNSLRRAWCFIRRTANRLKKWEEMKHNHRLLLTMEDRMLKDIGLSRADALRISNAHTFWKFVFHPEPDETEDESGRL